MPILPQVLITLCIMCPVNHGSSYILCLDKHITTKKEVYMERIERRAVNTNRDMKADE